MTTSSSTRSPQRHWIKFPPWFSVWGRSACIFLVLIGAAAWPMKSLWNRTGSCILTTESGSSTVPLFNAWTIVWNANRLQNGFSDYWNAPVFFPHRGTFAFSEPQPATILVAPALWVTESPALAYNLYLYLSLFLNGWFSLRLFRRLKFSPYVSLCGAVAMIWHPMALAQADVIQLIALWPVIWALTAALDLRALAVTKPASQTNRKRNVVLKGVEAGIASFSIFAVSVHHGLFVALLLPFSVWPLIPWQRIKAWWPGAFAASIVALMFLVPLLWPMHLFLSRHQFDRPPDLITALSANWGDVVNVPPSTLTAWNGSRINRPWYLSPGWLRTAVAIVGLWGMRSKRTLRIRPLVRFLVLLTLASHLFALGTNLQIAGWKPWMALVQWWPGVSQVRNVFRFGYFSQLSLILLCTSGFEQVWRLLARRQYSSQISAGGVRLLLYGLGLLLAIEIPPSPLRAVGVPNLAATQAWETFLVSRLHPGKGVVMLPYVQGANVLAFEQTCRWMLRMTYRGIPIVNGYSGFFPQSHFDNQTLFNADPFSEEAMIKMRASQVQFIVMQMPGDIAGLAGSSAGLNLVFQEGESVRIFELSNADSTPER